MMYYRMLQSDVQAACQVPTMPTKTELTLALTLALTKTELTLALTLVLALTAYPNPSHDPSSGPDR